MLDLASLLQTLCDQSADMSHNVVYEGPEHFAAMARPDELSRAVANLVDNAVKYGTKTIVRLVPMPPSSVAIEVEDDGPGIAASDREALLEPFARGDAARTGGDTSGFGLGLSIVRAAVEAHGGTLELRDRVPTGLIARIELPLSPTA